MHVSSLYAVKQFIKPTHLPPPVWVRLGASVFISTSFYLPATSVFFFFVFIGPQGKWLCLPFQSDQLTSGSSIH